MWYNGNMKICEVFNCNKPSKARGFCSAHYSKLKRTGSVLGAKGIDPNRQEFIPHAPKDPNEKCIIEGCDTVQLSKGWCNTHYLRNQNHGTAEPEDVLFRENRRKAGLCSKCGVNPRVVLKSGKLQSWCQSCKNEHTRKWNASEAGPRWRRYKLKKQDVIDMKVFQGNACAICGDSFNNVEDHVDHDNRCCDKEKVHNGGTCGQCVRALLCGSCNQGLGNFKDSVNRLEKAVAYLRKWS